MTVDIPTLLGAVSGAIPTLLLALVFQRPLLLGLVKVADMYRQGLDDLNRHRLGRWIVVLAPGVGGAVARNVDYVVIALGTLGMISSVALQAVPAGEWGAGGSWQGLVEPVFWFHLGIVAVLALTVGAGLLVITRGARAGGGDSPTSSSR